MVYEEDQSMPSKQNLNSKISTFGKPLYVFEGNSTRGETKLSPPMTPKILNFKITVALCFPKISSSSDDSDISYICTCKSPSQVTYKLPVVLIGEYAGGVLIHSPFDFFMWDRSEAKVLRNTSAGITLNFLKAIFPPKFVKLHNIIYQ